MNSIRQSQSLKINVFKVGNCLFKEPIEKILNTSDQQCIKTFKKRFQLESLIIRSASDLLSKQQYFRNWKNILQKMILCDMKNISAGYSPFNNNILKQIKHIQFQQLIFLELNSNHFNNIELLHLIKAPKLQQISLKNNRISKLKTLQKCRFPFLKIVNLLDNSNINLMQLRTMHFKQLKQIKHYSYYNQINLTWVIKLQSKKINYINKKIDQENVKNMIQKKCKQ